MTLPRSRFVPIRRSLINRGVVIATDGPVLKFSTKLTPRRSAVLLIPR